MPNGQEVGKENVAALEAWAATQSDEDLGVFRILCHSNSLLII
jgi:hypothetical protein